MRRLCVLEYVALVLLMVVPEASRGQIPDHLKCYKIRDTIERATYVADLGGVEPEPGCVIKVPPKLACVPSTKSNVVPSPPGGGSTGTPNPFFCYLVKCRKSSRPTFSGTDQFGEHTVTVLKSKLLCAPATVTTTTTTTTTCRTYPPSTAFYCGFNSCHPDYAICPTANGGGIFGSCRDDCTCPPMPCGSITNSNFCRWGECPPGQTCGGGPSNGCFSEGCVCH